MTSTEQEHTKQCNDATEINPCKEPQTPEKDKKSLSMHDNVPVWYDCCSCEAEPYWTEGTEEPTTK